MFLLRINITLALVALTLVACGSGDNSTTSQNGEDGVDGTDGVNGVNGTNDTSCTVSDDHAGTLTQTCTDGSSVSWSKALCGTQAYDPETHFCGADTVLELCGGASYDATTHFCNAATSAPMAAWSTNCLVAGNCGTFTDTRETPAKAYKWTKIGTQTWMAENLAYLPSVNNLSESSPSEARYYVYNYDGNVVADAKASSYYTTYGVLYNWTAALAGVCPTGWHLPSNAEWVTLETYVGGAGTAGTKLKSVSGWTIGGDTGTDAYGFSALPGGTYYGSGFGNALIYGYWWSAAECDATYACGRYMYYNVANVYTYIDVRNGGFSVRCLQD